MFVEVWFDTAVTAGDRHLHRRWLLRKVADPRPRLLLGGKNHPPGTSGCRPELPGRLDQMTQAVKGQRADSQISSVRGTSSWSPSFEDRPDFSPCAAAVNSKGRSTPTSPAPGTTGP